MAKVEMYSTMWCPYCARARALQERKGVEFTETGLMEQPGRRDEMIRRAGGRTTVPQVCIAGEPVGGCAVVVALVRAARRAATRRGARPRTRFSPGCAIWPARLGRGSSWGHS